MAAMFPKEPMSRDYWDVSNSPTLAARWQRVTINGQTFHVFWYGSCLYCEASTWATANGTTLAEMGAHGLMPVTDPESGQVYRACSRCGQDANRSQYVIAEGQRLIKAGEVAGPLAWPKNHPERMVTAR